MPRPKRLEGIETRLGRDGIQRYRGTVYAHGQKIRGQWTEILEDAVAWRQQQVAGARDGLLARERLALGRGAETWVAGIADGSIRNRSGRPYRQSMIRAYRRDILICVETLGRNAVIDDLRMPDVNRVVERLRKRGLSDSRVRHVIFTLRALYNWALPNGYATINPCIGLTLPAAEQNPRVRIATVEETALLVTALTVPDRTAFALACYAGLRAGEILPLRNADVDLNLRTVRVDRAIDTTFGTLTADGPKTRAGRRNVPIQDRLLAVLEDHADTCGWGSAEHNPTGLLFAPHRTRRGPRDGAEHFWSLSALHRRLRQRWRDAGLTPLGLHEARHTFASMLIGAGLGPKAVQTYMGHSSITITYDRYGHLFPGHEAEALELLNRFTGGER